MRVLGEKTVRVGGGEDSEGVRGKDSEGVRRRET